MKEEVLSTNPSSIIFIIRSLSVHSVSSVVNFYRPPFDKTRSCAETVFEANCRLVPQKLACQGDICKAIAHVANARRFENRLDVRSPGARFIPSTSCSRLYDWPQATLIVRPTAPGASAANRLPCTTLSMYVKSRDCLPSPKIVGPPPGQHLRNELGNHRRVLALRVLPRSEHVEIAQRHGLEAVRRRKSLAIEFARQLRCRVGRQRRGHQVFTFRRRDLIAVRAARSREHNPPHARFASRIQQVYGPGDACRIRVERPLDASRHRGQGRLVKYDLDSGQSTLDFRAIHKIALDELHPVPPDVPGSIDAR